MNRRVAGALIGIVFGVALSWSGMTSPVVIRQALLFEKSYLFLFMASAVATASVGLWLLRRRPRRAVLAETELTWPRERIGRRHIAGAVIFGIGWGISDACPGPVATQIGQGIGWGLLTLTGIAIGIYSYQRMGRHESEPATDPVAVSSAAARAT
jgi:uncharacterized membrane protein YedE/YeeE